VTNGTEGVRGYAGHHGFPSRCTLAFARCPTIAQPRVCNEHPAGRVRSRACKGHRGQDVQREQGTGQEGCREEDHGDESHREEGAGKNGDNPGDVAHLRDNPGPGSQARCPQARCP